MQPSEIVGGIVRTGDKRQGVRPAVPFLARFAGKFVLDIMPTALATFPAMPPDSAGYFRHNPTLEKDAGFNPLNRALLPIFPKLTDDERRRVL